MPRVGPVAGGRRCVVSICRLGVGAARRAQPGRLNRTAPSGTPRRPGGRRDDRHAAARPVAGACGPVGGAMRRRGCSGEGPRARDSCAAMRPAGGAAGTLSSAWHKDHPMRYATHPTESQQRRRSGPASSPARCAPHARAAPPGAPAKAHAPASVGGTPSSGAWSRRRCVAARHAKALQQQAPSGLPYATRCNGATTSPSATQPPTSTPLLPLTPSPTPWARREAACRDVPQWPAAARAAGALQRRPHARGGARGAGEVARAPRAPTRSRRQAAAPRPAAAAVAAVCMWRARTRGRGAP